MEETFNGPTLPAIMEEWRTERLVIRAVRPGEGAIVNIAIRESWSDLRLWMPWARTLPSPDDSEEFSRRAFLKFQRREELNFRFWLPKVGGQSADGSALQFAGAIGLHHIDWDIPKFEIGYWLRSGLTGHGYMTEAVNSVSNFAFQTLGAQRIEIRCDDLNTRSAAVAERAGFTLEGVLRHSMRSNSGELRDGRLYAKIR